MYRESYNCDLSRFFGGDEYQKFSTNTGIPFRALKMNSQSPQAKSFRKPCSLMCAVEVTPLICDQAGMVLASKLSKKKTILLPWSAK